MKGICLHRDGEEEVAQVVAKNGAAHSTDSSTGKIIFSLKQMLMLISDLSKMKGKAASSPALDHSGLNPSPRGFSAALIWSGVNSSGRVFSGKFLK